MQTTTLGLVHSTAEHCTPVWCRSAHTRLIDPAINNALQIVTRCLRLTPADNLPILAGIQPAELHHNGAILSLVRCDLEPGPLLHSVLTCHRLQMHNTSNRDTYLYLLHKQLISLSDNNNIRAVHWAYH